MSALWYNSCVGFYGQVLRVSAATMNIWPSSVSGPLSVASSPLVDDGTVQDLVDALAARLQRSVAVDDPSIRLIAASRHFGDEDAVRVQSVLGRRVDERLAQQVLDMGVRQLTAPARVELGQRDLKPRLCIPVRCGWALMGFLWLIDDGTLTEQQITDAGEVADLIGVRLYQQDAALERRRARQEILLRGLLSADAGTRADALREVQEEDLLHNSPHVSVAVIRSPEREQEESVAESEARLRHVGDKLLKSQPEDSTLVWGSRGRLVVLLQGGRSQHRAFEQQVRGAVAELHAVSGRRWTAGLANVDGGLPDAHAAFQRALIACRAAEHMPEVGDVVTWDALGVYGTLALLVPRDLPLSAYPAELSRLADAPGGLTMLRTAEVYLDLAGNVQRASSALHIHRGTLYQRLARIQRLCGLDLSNGVERLTLHLSIKLARLSGTYDELVSRASEVTRVPGQGRRAPS